MGKKTGIVPLILATFITNIYATGEVMPSKNYHFYLGAQVGPGMLSGSTYQAQNPATGDTHYAAAGAISVLAGGVAGIEVLFPSSLFLAGEANVRYDSLNQTVRSSTNLTGVINHGSRFQNNVQYGIDLKLGKNFNGAIPYLLFGGEAGRWTMNLFNNSGLATRGILANSSTNYVKTLFGLTVGMGVTFALSSNIKADLNYAYTWFGTINTTLIDPITLAQWNHQAKMRQGAALVALHYNFS